MTLTATMPLLERLRKGANCVGFLDGAPEPAEDVADMLRKAADEIERLRTRPSRDSIALIIATCQGNPETKDSWLPAADAILKEWPR